MNSKEESTKYFNIAAALLVLLLTCVIYLPSLKNGFVGWDDPTYISENSFFPESKTDILSWMLSPDFYSDWHPLTLLSHVLASQLWGQEAWGHHAFNLFLHLLNTSLVFMLTAMLFAHLGGRGAGMLLSAAVSLLFGIHPLNVEAVAWVSGRKELLCGTFYIASLLFYIKYAISAGRASYFLSFAAFIFALLSKPMAVTLPAILILIDAYPLARFRDSNIRRILAEKIPFFIISIFVSLRTMDIYSSAGTVSSMEVISFSERIYLASSAYVFYLTKLFLPTNLAPLYPRPESMSIFSLKGAAAPVLISLITFYVIRAYRKIPALSVAWFYFLIILLPVSGVVQSGIPVKADRYMYLPGIGLFAFAGVFSLSLLRVGKTKNIKRWYLFFMILLMSILGAKTVWQIGLWSDTVKLWSHEIRIFPHALAVPYTNRGNAYSNSGDLTKAMEDLNKAVAIDPAYSVAYNNRANVHFFKGEYEAAIKDYSEAVRLDRGFADAYYNLGNSYNKTGDYKRAAESLGKAIELAPSNWESYNNRGISWHNLGDYGRAIGDYEEAVRLNPNYAPAYINLGLVYRDIGQQGQAQNYFNKAAGLGEREALKYLINR